MSKLKKNISEVDGATIRFAGDSGDGMQLTGSQFSDNTAIFGNDLATLPDFPAEIRAPKGSLAGVSSFQLQFSNKDIHTPGDANTPSDDKISRAKFKCCRMPLAAVRIAKGRN